MRNLAFATLALVVSSALPCPGQEPLVDETLRPLWPLEESYLAERPKLKPPNAEEAKERVLVWLRTADPGRKDHQATVDKLWAQKLPVDALVEGAFSTGSQGAASLIEACRAGDEQDAKAAAEKVLTAESDPFFRTHLGYIYARLLTNRKMYDEARDAYSGLSVGDSIDPSGFLFFRGVCEFELLKKSEALDTLTRLSDDVESVPERYAALSRLMLFDLEYLDEEGLDHLSRTMDDIKRRLELGRVGDKVKGEEKEVIERLDKLIEKLEQQQGGGGGGGGPPGRGGQSNQGAKDSGVLRGKGAGDVDNRKLKGTSAWGNLPAKERAKLLQALGREFPSHYRNAVEEYFRKLAAEEPSREGP